MPRFEPDAQALALGEALSALRRAAGLSQAEAGSRAGMTGQGWGLYETGRRPGLYRPDVQRRMTAALDATPETLAQAALALTAGSAPSSEPATTAGLNAKGRAFAPAPGPRRLTIEDDALAPWATAGVVVEYEIGRRPRPGQGCVIETADGRRRVGLYEEDGDRIATVRFGPAEDALAVTPDLSLSAVIARLESR